MPSSWFRSIATYKEAIQFRDNEDELFAWAGGGRLGFSGSGQLAVITDEGVMEIADGAWLIRGIEGELYPCRDDIFKLSYAPAEGTR